MLKNLKPLLLFVLGIVLINILGNFFFYRFDLTSAQQYTLSNNTKKIIADVTEPVAISVFLKGDFPGEFKRLQLETQYLLEEFSALNKNVKFQFINPLNQEEDAQQVAQRFYQSGMTPESLNIRENGKLTERLMFPWAVAELNGKQVKIPLLKKNITSNNEEIVNLSIANLEYNFTSALNQLVYEKTKKIAVMRGNGELADPYIADFVNSLKEFYYIAPFTLDSTALNPVKTLKQLEGFDLVIEAKPSRAFTEKEKFVLDQYLMQGGKMLWLTEGVIIEKDSLFSNPENTALAMPKNLNLQDYFFSYGIRINPSLVQDLVSAPLVLAQGEGNNTQFKPIPWFYSPLAISTKEHPIIKNIEAVKLEFSSPIDTLERKGLKKTILLHSSPKTKLE
ncbi:gliding motility-associated ABC transporter substrate-binding protein GldG [uncultured Mesonia sp.]|uniref:gliding motility-associated ABC transporter substrate-binding protein GldG n=1 Tax=uncultured Mesonia sp. TaxID=399731 RepID=UPI00374F9FCC